MYSCSSLACCSSYAAAAAAAAAAAGSAGEGAYGQVYLGLNEKSGELMAVKSLQLLGRRGSRESQTQLSELKQELECYRNLSHTHIVGYIGNEFDTANNCLYIFLEYVPGGSSAPV
jgi:serine/threonine protein kinase